MTAPCTRRSFLGTLGLFAVAMALAGAAGCAHIKEPSTPPTPSATPTPRMWDDTEILRAGRWAG